MQHTKNEQLFLNINAHAGKHPLFDPFMIFCSRWLIFALTIPFFIIILRTNFVYLPFLFLFPGLGIALALAVHWMFAFIFRHPRPHVRFPESTQLVKTYQNFKSFPSDHAMIATQLALAAAFFSYTGPSDLGFLYLFLPFFVAIGRVYTGVHFPKDVVVGIVSGLMFSLLTGFFVFI